MSTDGHDSTSLVVLLADKADQQTWRLFVERFWPVIHGWCCGKGLQHADADDVTQKVISHLVEQIPARKFDRAKGPFRAWLRQVVTNAVIDHMRSRAREAVGTGDTGMLKRLGAEEARQDLGDRLLSFDEEDVLNTALAALRCRVTEAEFMIYSAIRSGQGPKEVAAAQGTTYVYVCKVKSKLTKLLKEEIARLDGPLALPNDESFSPGSGAGPLP